MPFRIITASVPGVTHSNTLSNNHDAYQFCITPRNEIIGVICDGCGSHKHSEVGAKIGCNLLVTSIMNNLDHLPKDLSLGDDSFFWSSVQHQTLFQIKSLAMAMCPDKSERRIEAAIFDYFLFTVVGFIIREKSTHIFWLGDGIFCVGDHQVILDSPIKNTPLYMTLALVDQSLTTYSSQLLTFQREIYTTEEIDSLLIGSDGVVDFVKLENKNLPGRSETLGPLSQFWKEDKYLQNSAEAQRHLLKANRTVIKKDPVLGFKKSLGILPDDTTFILARRHSD